MNKEEEGEGEKKMCCFDHFGLNFFSISQYTCNLGTALCFELVSLTHGEDTQRLFF
jgi:hypothetical protein